jgi:hypothetical protein
VCSACESHNQQEGKEKGLAGITCRVLSLPAAKIPTNTSSAPGVRQQPSERHGNARWVNRERKGNAGGGGKQRREGGGF